MAAKTEQDIERDFYAFVKDSAIGTAIKGKVYRSEMRPSDAKTEDVVVRFLSGLDEQIQTGVVILNVYVPDVKLKDGRSVIAHQRVGELQKAVADFMDSFSDTEYWIDTDVSPITIPVEEIGQHTIYTRIKFKRLNN